MQKNIREIFSFLPSDKKYLYCNISSPITVAARCKAWTVFARSNAGVVGSNPTQGIDVCIVFISSVFVLFGVQVEALRRADPRPRHPTDCVQDQETKKRRSSNKGL
jgi:hypothetical protein